VACRWQFPAHSFADHAGVRGIVGFGIGDWQPESYHREAEAGFELPFVDAEFVVFAADLVATDADAAAAMEPVVVVVVT